MQKYSKYLFLPTILFFLGASISHAQEALVVDQVDFNSVDDDWTQVVIELSCGENPDPEARDKDYIENVGVKIYLGYESEVEGEPFDFYTSEVEILIMERGEDYNVYFYLPGLVVERDNLPKEPEFYYAQISINGEVIQPKERTSAMSPNIRDLNVLTSFVSNAEEKGAVNESILAPIYFVYGIDLGRVSDLPPFKRSEPRD